MKSKKKTKIDLKKVDYNLIKLKIKGVALGLSMKAAAKGECINAISKEILSLKSYFKK